VFYIAQNTLWSVSAAGGPPDLVLDNVNQASISPDGQTVAYGNPGAGGGVWLYSLADQQSRPYPAPLEGQSVRRQLQFSPDGTRIGALWPTADGRIGDREKMFIDELQTVLQVDEATAVKIIEVLLIKNRG
jgi:hypothetical protein